MAQNCTTQGNLSCLFIFVSIDSVDECHLVPGMRGAVSWTWRVDTKLERYSEASPSHHHFCDTFYGVVIYTSPYKAPPKILFKKIGGLFVCFAKITMFVFPPTTWNKIMYCPDSCQWLQVKPLWPLHILPLKLSNLGCDHCVFLPGIIKHQLSPHSFP